MTCFCDMTIAWVNLFFQNTCTSDTFLQNQIQITGQYWRGVNYSTAIKQFKVYVNMQPCTKVNRDLKANKTVLCISYKSDVSQSPRREILCTMTARELCVGQT